MRLARALSGALTAGLLVTGSGAGVYEPAGPAAPDTASPVKRIGDNPEYDGRFQFFRVQYGGGTMRSFGRREPPWGHDYPRADRNFTRLLSEITGIHTQVGAGPVRSLADRDIFRFPAAYIVEVGDWRPTQEEVDNLGEYLKKGGFLIVDDFRGYRELDNFMYHLGRALDDPVPVEIPTDHEIWNSFFAIEDPYSLTPPYGRDAPVYLGVYEDNDPQKRLMVVINYNNDIAEYWEYADRGYYIVDLANEAFKFGVNYVMYAMTH